MNNDGKHKLYGTYGGIVETVSDPSKVGRLKVRVPAIYGTANDVPTEQLPWALPRGLPFGSTASSGGISWLPSNGDTVWVTFLDGEPEKPLWEWAIAPVASPTAKMLHQYDEANTPKRSALTRYGHVIEFNQSSIVLATPTGEMVVLNTSDKTVQVQNLLGYVIRLDQEAITLMAGSQIIKLDVLSGQVSIVSGDLNIVANTNSYKSTSHQIRASKDVSIKAGLQTSVKAQSIKLEASAKTEVTSSAITLTGQTTAKVTVGQSTVEVSPESLKLKTGSKALTINSSGFNFTG